MPKIGIYVIGNSIEAESFRGILEETLGKETEVVFHQIPTSAYDRLAPSDIISSAIPLETDFLLVLETDPSTVKHLLAPLAEASQRSGISVLVPVITGGNDGYSVELRRCAKCSAGRWTFRDCFGTLPDNSD